MWAMMPLCSLARTLFSMPELTRELRIIGLLGVTTLLLASICLATIENYSLVIQWLLISALLWGLVWQQSAKRLKDNRESVNDALYPSLGWANRLTILRGFLIALCAGFLWQSFYHTLLLWLPAFFYSVAAILDRVDGFVARKTQQTSLMGNALDNVFDALGLLIAPLLALNFAKIHWAYLLVSGAYYAFHLGLRWRSRNGLPNHPLTPNLLRRTLAGFQMGYIAVVLWPPFDAQITRLAGFAFMLPILIGFIVDWFVVSGRIDLQRGRSQKFFDALAMGSINWVQPCLRLLFLIALAAMTAQGQWQGLTLLGQLFAAGLITFGFGARLGALLALILIALLPPEHISAVSTIFLFSATWIMLLGSGRFSLWQGDDHWVERQDGAS
tara:strand:- start:30133 stop:31287 length:1155 start_codon:yes stop_codon:yes gene_type:complete